MATKHDLILEYIESLPVGNQISTRNIAEELNVSEGTAYRAIKDTENVGLVSTIQRVGTIRIGRKLKKHTECLTLSEVIRIIKGDVLSGAAGLSEVLNKLVIGAITKHATERYITSGSLIIVGNRVEVQKLALEDGTTVLITGEFNTTVEIAKLADDLEMPILRASCDTFTVATMISQALSDQSVKKGIVPASDTYMPAEKTRYLWRTDTISDYQRLSEETQHSRFPIVNRRHRLMGIATARDVLGKSPNQIIDRVMTEEPTSVKKTMSITSVSHQMTWDGLEVMPVVFDNLTLEGLITRQDVMKVMQLVQRQPQIVDTISDQISGNIYTIDTDREGNRLEDPEFKFVVTPQMVNGVGTISFGVLNEIISDVIQKTMVMDQERNILIERMNLRYLRLIWLESELDIRSRALEIGRHSAKLDIKVFIEGTVVSKVIIIRQIMGCS